MRPQGAGRAVTGTAAVLAAGRGPSHRLILTGLNAEAEGGLADPYIVIAGTGSSGGGIETEV